MVVGVVGYAQSEKLLLILAFCGFFSLSRRLFQRSIQSVNSSFSTSSFSTLFLIVGAAQPSRITHQMI